MSKKENKNKEASPEETREAERLKWLEERQTNAVKENEPIKDVFRVTVAVDIASDGTDEARAAVKNLKGEGVFVYGIKGVRRLHPLFETSEEFKRVSKLVKTGK
ncbi:hypothetical protein KAW18_18560 [candidate division WOR-3 bacterium]|nr:hypothetical protein [candidate division WOR-3 bacterium]